MNPKLRAALTYAIGIALAILLWQVLPGNWWVAAAILMALAAVWFYRRRRGA